MIYSLSRMHYRACCFSLCLMMVLFLIGKGVAQVGINSSGNPPHSSAALDVDDSGRGTLITRMTSGQRDQIQSPAEGLLIFNTTTKCFEFFAFGIWQSGMCGVCPVPASPSLSVESVSESTITWQWSPVLNATGYKRNTVNDYSTATDMGMSLDFLQSGLSCGSTHELFVWAYNDCGQSAVATLEQQTFSCPCTSFNDARDGKTYSAVQIGTQCWMAQNLNVGTQVSGSVAQSNNGTIEKYCYNNDAGNCTTYGGLYQWAELVGYLNNATNDDSWSPLPSGSVQGICPAGWHIPSEPEWNTLVSFLGGSSTAGGHLKEVGTSHWASPNTGADNSSGFTALSAGNRVQAGGFSDMGQNTTFWTSDDQGNQAALRNLYAGDAGVQSASNLKLRGFSVRCIRD